MRQMGRIGGIVLLVIALVALMVVGAGAATTYLKGLSVTTTATSGTAVTINGYTTMTSGTALKIVLDDDIATTPYYINCLGGSNHATSVFNIGKYGVTQTATVISSNTPGTVRSITGAMTASGSAIASGNLVGVRGSVTISGATTGSASQYYYGVQGKFINSGTLNDAAGWHTGVYAQLDLSAGTYTAGQIAGLWVDMGAAANASAKALAPSSIDCIRITNTPSGFLPRAILSAVANATYFMDLAAADGTPGWYDASSTANGSCIGHLKIQLGGAEGFIRVYGTN